VGFGDVCGKLALGKSHSDNPIRLHIDSGFEGLDITLDGAFAVDVGRIPTKRLGRLNGALCNVCAKRRNCNTRYCDYLLMFGRLSGGLGTDPPCDWLEIVDGELKFGFFGMDGRHQPACRFAHKLLGFGNQLIIRSNERRTTKKGCRSQHGRRAQYKTSFHHASPPLLLVGR
jgi:hypothetical protein